MIFGFAHPLLKPQVLEQSRPILNCVFALTALTKISLFCIMDAGIFSSPFEGEFAALASGGGPESLRSVQSLSIARHCVSSSPPPTRPSVLHNASTPMGPKQDVNMLRGSDIQKVQQLPTAQESAANSSGSRSAASADSTAWLFANA
mmetsp:Transcript_17417/g.34219  ORF Transcript_17417/g.34219 Transcript_17417/m.34219 type:complete len:147 (+) Transcript_17417:406-846(+)